ncbi:MAG: hypothetical protein AAF456_14870 [Planctomycetota bacterium]
MQSRTSQRGFYFVCSLIPVIAIAVSVLTTDGSLVSGPQRYDFECDDFVSASVDASFNESSSNDDIDVELTRGFKITKVAGDELATNIFSLTVNAAGQPVVSGPGYIATLSDSNGDGIFDESTQYSDGPRSGAQGMLFIDGGLLFTGDGGLHFLADEDRNGIADGPPELLIPMKTGGEHHSHAIRRGPDGAYYVIAGNHTGILDEYQTTEKEPVADPRAGFVLRISPDFSERTVYVHGFRNAYDFDFNLDGEIVVFDSDGERDISLPWYRPTRVYRMNAGDDAGWMTEAWKRPSHYFDMPETIGFLGRGSPTGVCCYSHTSFGTEYLDAAFVADWTFGKVFAIKRDPSSGRYLEPEVFASASGSFGFAVTDLEVEPDSGNLFVTVGGRGTQGGVYRIERQSEVEYEIPPSLLRLAEIQTGPLAAFSLIDSESDRERDKMIRFASDVDVSVRQLGLMRKLNQQGDRSFRTAMLVWLGGQPYSNEFWNDESPGAGREMLLRLVVETASRIEAENEWRNLFLWMNACRSMPEDVMEAIRDDASLSTIGLVALDVAVANNIGAEPDSVLRTNAIGFALEQCRSDQRENYGVLIRLAQLAGGGCGRVDGVPPVYHGYTAVIGQPEFPGAQSLELVRRIEMIFDEVVADGDLSLEHEVSRLAAMTGLCSDSLASKIVQRVSDNTAVPDDVHNLAVLSLSGVELENEDAAVIGNAIIKLRSKIATQARNEERNWVPRFSTIAGRLMQQPAVALSVINDPRFVADGNEYLFRLTPGGVRQRAEEKAIQFIVSLDPDEVTGAQLEIVRTRAREYPEFVRSCCRVRSIREQAVRILCGIATDEDLTLLVDALEYGNLSTTARVAKALSTLENGEPARELGLCMRSVMRLGTARPEVSTRDALFELIGVRTGKSFEYEPGAVNDLQAEAISGFARFVASTHPEVYEEILGALNNQAAGLAELAAEAQRLEGDALRGEELYRVHSCVKCHQGGNRMGPSLDGITSRFSFDDIQVAIAMPDLTVSDRYKAINIQTIDGELHRGIVIYESMDGVTLGNTLGDTIRLNQEDIEARSPSRLSPMPSGLVEDFDAQDWADLYAYLKTL